MTSPRKFSQLSLFLIALLLVVAIGSRTQRTATAAATDLFFSEYIEGSSNNKALEIYNGTGAAVDLSANNYDIQIYFNGATSAGTTIVLSGILVDGDVYVVADNDADGAILAVADLTSTSNFFNGDDVVVLRKGGVVIDAMGQLGNDPGTEWGSGDTSTADNTLRRKVEVCAGDADATDTFDPATEWDGFAQNTFDGLGVHTASCEDNGGPSDGTVLLSELVVTPTGGEFIELHNPTPDAIDLSNYYITDATFAGGSTYYYNIVTGTNAGGGSFGDFHARFPDGATIAAGDYQTIALAGSSAFLAEYGVSPDYELFDDSSNDGEQQMREANSGSINGQGGLSNDGEVVILFYWDGQSDLVSDVDYALWGDKVEGVDKTGVAIDGPDAGSDASSYLPDTTIASQDVVSPGSHASGDSWQREDLEEGAEIAEGGNGLFGNDETSEDLSNTWCVGVPTPSLASECAPPPPAADLIINELHTDPDAALGDANGDGTVNTTQDEFVELVNNSDSDLDISGWTISDAFGMRHVFPAGTIVPANCAIVVFAGGTPTGSFGNSVVQTASSGQLGLNNGGDTVTVQDGANNVVAIYTYGGEGGNNQSLTRDPDITGGEPLILHSTATNSGGTLFSPGTLVNGSGFSGCAPVVTIGVCGDPATLIHEVQGNGLASPIEGATVVLEGIVVGDFQNNVEVDSGELNGFYIQEEDSDADADTATSEGVFVFAPGAADVSVGEHVRVGGDVAEFSTSGGASLMTEISNVFGILSCADNVALPSTTDVTLPVTDISDFERYEGMLVNFPQELVISEYFNYDRFGEIVLALPTDGADPADPNRPFNPTAVVEPEDAAPLLDLNLRSRITLDDGLSSQNPSTMRHPNGGEFNLVDPNIFRGGDIVENAIGVMDNTFGLYRIQPTAPAEYSAVNLRSEQPEAVGGSLKVASFNVLNYFTTLDQGGNLCGPPGFEQECRGANDADELARQRAKIIAALAEMNADIVGLIEIQNDEGAATADLVAGLNDVLGAGTYDFIETGYIGTDAIKVAFIYKPATVSTLGAYEILDSTDDPRFDDTRNRPMLAQTFVEDATGGVVTVAVNHLKSKGSDCGGPPDDDPFQGNCNGTRTLAAQAIVDWLASDPTDSGDADFLVIGDLNSYDKEDPIDVLVNNGYTDLVAKYQGEYAYSYVFDGQFGYLDHALANSNLVPQIRGTTVWHINADEVDLIDYDTTFKSDAQDQIYEPNAYRSSDHDPVIVGLDLNGSPNCEGAAPSMASLWPPDHQFVAIDVLGVTDPDGDPITITIDSIMQDEAVDAPDSGNTAPDGMGVGTATAQVRAERVGTGGNGRVYHISFTVTDDAGGSCGGEVLVSVPVARHMEAVDDGPLYDSTVEP